MPSFVEKTRKHHFEQFKITSNLAESYFFYRNNDIIQARESLLNAYEEVIKSNHWLNPYAFKRNINYIFYLEQNLIPIKSTIWLLKILLISLMLQKT